MKTKRYLLAVTILLLLSSFIVGVLAEPSNDFTKKVFEIEDRYIVCWYDDWGVNRNSAYGMYVDRRDGYLPKIIYESLGQNRERAYEMGELFVDRYPDHVRRAEAILSFVQTWMKYGYDNECVFREGVAQEEWAWNPDEMAHEVDEAQMSYEPARGDCEDFGFYCTVLYLAAGYDVKIIDAPEHVALMIWLPEYPNANVYWDVNDGRGPGWIWVEATVDTARLGWTPSEYRSARFEVCDYDPIVVLYKKKNDNNNGPCIIATVTYGSKLAPEVQFLRGFRDNLVLSTFAGSQFMQVFNAWYYSFSPETASFIAQEPIVKAVMRAVLYPLIGILHLSSGTYHVFGFSPELGVLMAGLVASALIGVVYFSLPAAVLLVVIKRFGGKMLKIGRLKIAAVPLFLSLAMIVLGESIQCQSLMMVSTAMFVLTTLSTSALTVGLKITEKLPLMKQ